jgi:hypothetical protein
VSEWPPGMTIAPIREWPGAMTRRRTRSQFSARNADRLELLTRELRMLNAKNIELLVAIDAGQFRLDGKPRAGAKSDHPGVILSFTSSVGPLSYPCDTYDRWEDNLYAIARSLEALRAVNRHGVTKRGEQYRGFLPIESGAVAPDPFHDAASAVEWISRLLDRHEVSHAVEGVDPMALVRIAQRLTHPDHGGDANDFRLVTAAEKLIRAA